MVNCSHEKTKIVKQPNGSQYEVCVSCGYVVNQISSKVQIVENEIPSGKIIME